MCSNDKKLEAALMMEKDVYDITYAFKDKRSKIKSLYNNTGLLVDIKFLLSCSTRREIPYLCAPMYHSLYINSNDDSTVGVIKHLTRQMCYF